MLSLLGTLYNGLYGDSPSKRGIFFWLEVYKTGTAEYFSKSELTSDLQIKAVIQVGTTDFNCGG